MATKAGKPLKHRSVVSSFIFKFEDGKPMVALFRRSDKVSTYQHHLAPISGGVEETDPSPLAAAWREISEETTLTPASLVLTRQGKSFSFDDESIGRSWTVYPFAFRLKTAEEGGRGEQGIQIDWEHEGWGWYDPLQVEDSDDFGGVPRLAKCLRRVWFEKDLGAAAGRVLSDGLDTLKNDHQSGARQLAGVALQILREVISKLDSESPTEEWWTKVRFAAWHIWKNGRESMGAAIMNVLLSALSSIEDTVKQHTAFPDSSHSMKWKDAVMEDLERRISLRNTASSSLVTEALAKYLESTYADRLASHEPLSILTLSESSTISHSIRHLALKSGFALDLRVLESRPLFEGVSMAAAFLDDVVAARQSRRQMEGSAGNTLVPKIKVSLYSDASAALASNGVDVVIVGADRIASNGAVSNKTGTLPTILSARHIAALSGKPVKVIVLGESEKVAPPGSPDEHVVEENDPNQLSRAWSAEYNSARVRHGGSYLTEISKGAERAPADGLVEVAVHNVFFEWVSSELIDLYMTEFGQWTVKEISKHSSRLATEEERLFGDL
ncbi:nagb/rpia/CoA transferase-like protein [Coniochaeta ligniaria NRRL 30616]|uniref:Nagb/rpia/CoA transferase-like protein n=1 Tax=Coniochaeta ligniaria NRRL 30616 TaxID=1408157 RepID=A0A1J7IW76_9PEZI|nr:nagb/rpia/CoA transferase-like protein [Coniochaeta ligniaria NRRL 30616]